jgi:hypothetical protein
MTFGTTLVPSVKNALLNEGETCRTKPIATEVERVWSVKAKTIPVIMQTIRSLS